jgi:hypothetical protein
MSLANNRNEQVFSVEWVKFALLLFTLEKLLQSKVIGKKKVLFLLGDQAILKSAHFRIFSRVAQYVPLEARKLALTRQKC